MHNEIPISSQANICMNNKLVNLNPNMFITLETMKSKTKKNIVFYGCLN